MPPDPPRKLALWALERRQKYVTSGASTNMSAALQNHWNLWYPIVSQTLQQRKTLSSPLNKPKIAGGEWAESDWISGDGVQWLFYYEKVTSVLGNIPFHKGNEWAWDGNSRQNLSQLPVIIPVELWMSSKLFYKVSFQGRIQVRVQGVRTPPWDDLRLSNTTGILQKKCGLLVLVTPFLSGVSPSKKNPGSAPAFVYSISGAHY